ncbi:MAG: hypothetical protein JWQ01_746 [Massilia sp.]|nr:hypothetical protein [Massilia sp.]
MHGGAVAIERAPTLILASDDKAFERTWFALAVAVMLHAVLLNSVLRDRAPAESESARRAVAWLNIAPPVARTVEPPPPPPPRSVKSKPAPVVAAARVLREQAAAAEPEPVHVSAAQILSAAKRDVGMIDRELRKEGGGKSEPRLSADSPLQRLARGIERAHDAAPNKWYQAAKIEDITPPGDDARKIYRITSVLAGTYCVRYPDKNKIGNQTGAANLGEPLISKCPEMF